MTMHIVESFKGLHKFNIELETVKCTCALVFNTEVEHYRDPNLLPLGFGHHYAACDLSKKVEAMCRETLEKEKRIFAMTEDTGGKPVLIISPDRVISVPEGVTLDESAIGLWNALQGILPPEWQIRVEPGDRPSENVAKGATA